MEKIFAIVVVFLVVLVAPVMGMDGHSTTNDMSSGGHDAMEHGSMTMPDRFIHSEMADGVHAEFQVMSLASMKMTDPEGKSHHIMATFMRDDVKIERLAGKVKVIAPSGKEQIADLIDYGGGNFAANFSFDEMGKYGVICLFKDDKGKHTVKFWYEHQEM